MTPSLNFSSGNKLYWRQRSVLSAKLYLAAEVTATTAYIVIGTAMKRCIGTSHTLIRGPWGSQNFFKPKRHYLVLVASVASDLDVWGVYGCNFSWRFQWHHQRLCLTSTAGDIVNLSPSTFSYPWQLPTSMASLFLPLALNLSPVSLSPAIIVHQYHCHRQYTCIYKYLREFKTTPMEYLGAWGTMIHEKNLKSKISCQTPFNKNLWSNQAWQGREFWVMWTSCTAPSWASPREGSPAQTTSLRCSSLPSTSSKPDSAP